MKAERWLIEKQFLIKNQTECAIETFTNQPIGGIIMNIMPKIALGAWSWGAGAAGGDRGNCSGDERQPYYTEREVHRSRDPCSGAGFQERVWDLY